MNWKIRTVDNLLHKVELHDRDSGKVLSLDTSTYIHNPTSLEQYIKEQSTSTTTTAEPIITLKQVETTIENMVEKEVVKTTGIVEQKIETKLKTLNYWKLFAIIEVFAFIAFIIIKH
jgi:hypothetical protein